MNDTVIKVKHLSKGYRLGTISHGTLYRDLQSWSAKLFGKEDPNSIIASTGCKVQNGTFKALDDVSFDVKRGGVLGIIGRNGAGKSTLLKILSQITAPSSGTIKIKGRVASLLEVGTGFHPELTGRDNVFLNGAILGLRKHEIRRKFDEIVNFSGVERFIDTPVKRYSSGMYVRLAFAVAAHLEPEILIVDEVLSVGDAEFQTKCLGKMDDVAKKQGRTVLFVSHNMQAVQNLCSHCILLDKGQKKYEGKTDAALIEYNSLIRNTKLRINQGEHNQNRRGSGTISFTNIEILDIDDRTRHSFNIGETVRFKLSYKTYKEIVGLQTSVCLYSSKTRELLTEMRHEICDGLVRENERGTVIIEADLTSIRPGEYSLYFWLSDKRANALNNDIVDDLTEPLIIKPKNEQEKKLAGYFSVSSKLIKA